MDPGAGVAVSAKACPGVNVVLQVAPQSIPDGLLDTLPLPVPEMLKVRAGELTVIVKELLVPPKVVTFTG